jgi:hypothetical protein
MELQLYINPHSPIQGQANAISIFSSILVVSIASVESNASLVKSAKLGMFICITAIYIYVYMLLLVLIYAFAVFTLQNSPKLISELLGAQAIACN